MKNYTSRNDGIDLFRGFSILSVILLHCYIHMPFSQNLFPQRLINIVFRSGYYGVIIFFVISGFLITTTALRRWGNLQSIPIGEFYKMRFARIMPCLLVLLGVMSLLEFWGVTGFTLQTISLTQAVFSTLTFQINWLEAKTGYLSGNWGILWSLSVEEMFYLFFPLTCLLLKRPSYFICAMLVFIILGPFARTVFTDNEIWSDHSYLSCMDGIAIGCIAALFSHHFKLTKKSFFLILLSGLALFIFIFIFRKQAYEIGISTVGLNITILEIGTGLILIAMQEWYAKANRSGGLWTAPLRWLGTHSYEIYLTHMFFVIVISRVLFDATQSGFIISLWYVIALIMSGICGQLISIYFSEPMNQLIRRRYCENYTTIEKTQLEDKMNLSKLELLPLEEKHIDEIVDAFTKIGWNKPKTLYEKYLNEQGRNLCTVLIARYQDTFCGYVTLKWQSEYSGFNAENIPEISDLNVLPGFRGKGIGTMLIHACEENVKKHGHNEIGLGVGMTADYGSAQRLYVYLGYVPDGNGLHYQHKALNYGNIVTVDDDLVLYFRKSFDSKYSP